MVDEPLYGYHLAATGLDHPGRDDVLAGQPTGWRTVVAELTTARCRPAPGSASGST